MAKVSRSNTGLSLLLSLLLCNFITDLEASHQDLNQPYRTGYHFRPARNWMNDPNGPMIYKGIYHLFYQYNPYGAVWDVSIVWGHSTSVDLVNWTPQPPAFHPSQPSDINGCWSGSVTILPNGKPVILYTGIDQNKSQVQNVAVPVNVSDPYLREWSKPPLNPVMTPNAVNGINPDRFRDPTTAWRGLDGEWRVIVGSSTDDRRGLAILYKSKDFFNWTQSTKPLHYEDLTGMWECPDFFPVSITGLDGVETSSFVQNETKSVLKVSLFETSHDYYTIGSYDREKDVYVPDLGFVQDVSAPRLDYGKYYASKTFYDDVKKRRILWGWVNESSPAKDDIEKGWSGLQSFPRKIWLDESGKQLVQWPIEEIETLRGTQVNWHNKLLKSGSTLKVHGVTAAQADVEVSFKVKELEKADVIEQSWTDPQKMCSQENLSVKSGLGPFGLMVLASNGMEEYTSVYFRIFMSNDTNKNTKYVVLMCSDQSRSSLNEENDKTTFGAFVAIDPSNQTLSLRTLIDHSIVESYGGGGRTCITSRVYPKLAIGENANIFAFNKGTQSVDVLSLSAWSLKSAQINDEGDPLYVKVNKLSSTKTQLPYDYYYLNYCKLKIWGRFSEEMALRMRIRFIFLKMFEDQPCRVGCRIKVMLSLLKISGKRLMMNTELILPEQAWYMKPGFSILIGGILSFGAVFIELFFILTSIWLNQFYYIFGFLFIVFLILIVTCEENIVVLCYAQFCSEDYNWRWRAYFTSGSSSLYIFLYSIFYFFTKLEISKLVSGVLYFGYMIIVSYSFFVLTGSLGFYACLWFVRKIYSSVKID